MARKNQHTFSKRQRELKKAEKLADKRARRAHRKDVGLDPATPEEDTPPEGDEEAPQD